MFNKKDTLIAYQVRNAFANVNDDKIVQQTKLDILANKIANSIVSRR
ncbi:hypothetical protein IKE96_01455 [bacterium]|nr:hypothetical protein [bacterium]MBR2857860.1 hypothetical protein [bacterium]